AALQPRLRLHAHRRPAEGDRGAGGGHPRRRPLLHAAGRDRHRQDHDHDRHDRSRPAPRADHGPKRDVASSRTTTTTSL
ncbi:MAG: hypothetical protein AVDCRST_MAG91-2637, partial [uncultured Sphingomonadaceae bacterium]